MYVLSNEKTALANNNHQSVSSSFNFNVSLTINPLISVRIKAENMKDLKKNTQQKSNDITNGLQRYANSNNNSNNGYAKKYINSNFDNGIRKNLATQANTAKFIRTAIINALVDLVFVICFTNGVSMARANKNSLKNNVFADALGAWDVVSAYIEVVNNIKSNNVMVFLLSLEKAFSDDIKILLFLQLILHHTHHCDAF